MKQRELADDSSIIASEATVEEAVPLLKLFAIGESWVKVFPIHGNPNDAGLMMRYIQRLQDAGLDIGRGDAQFGFRMPPPAKDASSRNLEIFRRR